MKVIFILLLMLFCFSKCKQKTTKPELEMPLIKIRPLHSYGIKNNEQTNLLVYMHDENIVYTSSDTTEWLPNDLINVCIFNKRYIQNNRKDIDSTFLIESKKIPYVTKEQGFESKHLSFKTLCRLFREINDKTFFSLLDEINIKSEFVFYANTSPFTCGWCKQTFSGEHIYWTFRENKKVIELLVCLPQQNIVLFYKVKNQYFTPSINLKRGDISVFYPFVKYMTNKFNKPLKKGINDTLLLSLAKTRLDGFVPSEKEMEIVESLPFNYMDYIKPTLVEIQNIKNNEHHSRSFYKAIDGEIRIMGFGEAMLKERNIDWEYEEIAFIFDIKNTKQGEINADDHKYMFSFIPGRSYISGIYNYSRGIKYKLNIVSDTLLNMEVFFPWTVLETGSPDVNKTFGFDVSVTDNDGVGRETKVFWCSDVDYVWKDMSTIGTIAFGKGNSEKTSVCNSIFLEQGKIIIDGLYDAIWDKTNWYEINNIALGKFNRENDLNARFKTMYDEQGIYFYIRVSDNMIWDNYGELTELRDYAVILDDEKKSIVWKMKMNNTKSFSGQTFIRKINNTILLEKGHYTLHYTTNSSIGPDDWRFVNPIPFFYGVKIYEEK